MPASDHTTRRIMREFRLLDVPIEPADLLTDSRSLYCRLESALDIYLIDGTYELFRHYYAVPSARDQNGHEVGAVRGVVASIFAMHRSGATHLAIATDHVIESFRNRLWPGYKTSAGIAPDLLAQFPLLEEALAAFGFVVWPMVEFEADDALAAGAATAARIRAWTV